MYDSIWLLGDEFLTKAQGHLFKSKIDDEADAYYMREHFDIKVFADNNLSVLDSVIGHICNALVQGVNDKSRLPKAILIIIDEDLDVVQDDHHQKYVMGTLIHWIISEFNKIVEMQKDILPRKAVKPEYPTFIWIAPPLNVNFVNNDYRQTVTTCIKDATEVHSCHIMMKMVKVWDSKDQLLYRNGRFTEIGFSKYWAAIDSAVQFWDKHLVPKGNQVQKPSQTAKSDDNKKGDFQSKHRFFGRHNPVFTWNKNSRFRSNGRNRSDFGWKLLTPPPSSRRY